VIIRELIEKEEELINVFQEDQDYETKPEKIYLRFNRKIDETLINIIRKLSSITISDLVAIKKTQLGPGLKLISKYLTSITLSCY